MPCNPSVGGPAKGHLVREIDALGGEIGRCADLTFLQIRLLNTGKGPAVQAVRTQADKRDYQRAMRHALERQPNLTLKQAMVDRLLVEAPEECGENQASRPRASGVVTSEGTVYRGRTVVVTTGTFLKGRIIVGDHAYPAGRAGEFPAEALSNSLAELGFPLVRLKTGTPPRIDARTIDFSKTIVQRGSDEPLRFSWRTAPAEVSPYLPTAVNPVYPAVEPVTWRLQLPCYVVHTNPRTHDIIRRNLDRAPLFNGMIEGIGPRYCPSIEDKIVRFSHKESHQLFLEPEGWETNEVYVQGANTSLPEDVQLAMLRSIPALEQVEMVRTGYAIEYDAVPTTEIRANLETKRIEGLFFAGQINGTSGYEEAAAQGLMAGINAVQRVRSLEPVILSRDRAYIGVLIDDLTTKRITEPYRSMTSRAEYRLLLRSDNADLRLTPLAFELGLVDRQRYEAVESKREQIEIAMRDLRTTNLLPSDRLNEQLSTAGLETIDRPVTAIEFMRRPAASYRVIAPWCRRELSTEVAEQVEIEAKYEGYIVKQRASVDKARRLEEWRLPEGFDYDGLVGLRAEARQRLGDFRPLTLGQASRIEGVNPADVALLMVHLQRRHRRDRNGRVGLAQEPDASAAKP
jgi:tRNA uridine 5-carboxymethylaminomethyl modification enzyme